MSCKHENFNVQADIARLEDIGRFMMNVHVWCEDCGVEMKFLGLPGGLNFDRPTVSVDGLCLRAPIHPEGKDVPKVEGLTGFDVKVVKG